MSYTSTISDKFGLFCHDIYIILAYRYTQTNLLVLGTKTN